MLEFWLYVYLIGSFSTLYFALQLKEAASDEIPMWLIWTLAILWFIFMPPALFMTWRDNDDEF